MFVHSSSAPVVSSSRFQISSPHRSPLCITAHDDRVCIHSIACSKDGKCLASAADDGIIKIWDALLPDGGEVACRRELHIVSRIPGHTASGAVHLAVSPDCQLVAVGNASCKSLCVWKMATGEIVLCGRPLGFSALAFAPDSKSLVTTSFGRKHGSSIQRWDVSGSYAHMDDRHCVERILLPLEVASTPCCGGVEFTNFNLDISMPTHCRQPMAFVDVP